MNQINYDEHSLARRVLDYISTEPLIKRDNISVKAILYIALAELDSPTSIKDPEVEERWTEKGDLSLSTKSR